MPKSTSPFHFSTVSSRLYREALSRFATGVTVVTAGGKSKTGVTISSFAGVSLNPPLILFCLDEKSSALTTFKKGAVFAVNILAEDQSKLAPFFAKGGTQRWKKIRYRTHALGAPVLEGAMAVLLCRLTKKVKAGDHAVILGRVLEINVDDKKRAPLLHTQRTYWGLGKKK